MKQSQHTYAIYVLWDNRANWIRGAAAYNDMLEEESRMIARIFNRTNDSKSHSS